MANTVDTSYDHHLVFNHRTSRGQYAASDFGITPYRIAGMKSDGSFHLTAGEWCRCAFLGVQAQLRQRHDGPNCGTLRGDGCAGMMLANSRALGKVALRIFLRLRAASRYTSPSWRILLYYAHERDPQTSSPP
jgi:hypothetical protein